MHCEICDRTLTPEEIIFNKELETYEPCTTCLDVIMDAAYGRSRPDDDEEGFIILDSDWDGEGEELSFEFMRDEYYD